MTAQSAAYVYCVIESATRPSPGRVPAGVPGATRPRVVPLHGRLYLVVADVPLAVYGEEALDENIRNLEWVSEAAVGHEAVVEHFTRVKRATVVPLKLLTMFSSEEKAREEMRRRRRDVQSVVRRIAGCEEWGVRVFAAPAGAAAAPRPKSSEAMTGTAFLSARKAARDADQRLRARAIDAAGGVYDTLAGLARRATQRPRTGEPGTNPPLLDAAFLVSSPSRARFKAAARRQAALCAAAGAQMTLTGPWPAYNFAGDAGEAT